MLPFTNLSLQLFFHMYSIREGPDTCRNVWIFPFADAISLQWVPVGGIYVKASSPGAEQPFLQGPAPLSDSSRRAEMMAMPASAFDFLSISLCFHTALLIADRPHCAPLLKERFENALFVM